MFGEFTNNQHILDNVADDSLLEADWGEEPNYDEWEDDEEEIWDGYFEDGFDDADDDDYDDE